MKKKRALIISIIIILLLCVGIYLFLNNSKKFYPKEGKILDYNYTIGESKIVGTGFELANGYTKTITDNYVEYTIVKGTNTDEDKAKIYVKDIKKEYGNTVTIIVTTPYQIKGDAPDWVCYSTVKVRFDTEPENIIIKDTEGNKLSLMNEKK